MLRRPKAREEDFAPAESYFVELAAGLVGQAIERRDFVRELDEREKTIKQREEVYRAVVDSSFDLVFQIDDEGQLTSVSAAVEELLGYPATDYIGKPFTTMLPNEETVELAEQLYEEVMAGQTVEEEYFSLEGRSEEPVLVDLRVTPLYAGDVPPEDRTAADIVGAQGMARDASDRHRRLRLIRVLNRVLRHNLRNDMNVISGFATVLQDRLVGEEAAIAGRIADASDRIVALSDTARKLEENLDAPRERSAMDVVPPVARAAAQIDERYPDASVTVDLPETAVAKSSPRLETALWELFDNAGKHAGDSPSIDVTVVENDARVLIRLCDDGPGLPEQERAVLESGEETPLIHGSGLGLGLIHWIVDTLEGDLSVSDWSRHCIEIFLESASTTQEPN